MQGAVATAAPTFAADRRAMVDGQIRTFDVTDQAVIQAFSSVPRENFLPAHLQSLAYSDAVLTLGGAGQTRRVMLQPMHLARMMQGATVRLSDSVLVVAGASGYAACLLATLARSVITLESDPTLSEAAAVQATRLGYAPVEAVTGPLVAGHKARAPFDVIFIQGAVETNLDALYEQLAPDGRLVAIETKTGPASRRSSRAIRIQRIGRDISERPLFDATAPIIPEFAATLKFIF